MAERGGRPVRVLLLARAGEARQRLESALGEAGAELVRSVDPAESDPAEILALRPGAVLVALEPAIEAALEGHDALLSDPDVLVMFDEADLAARRDGWDAARWIRHLAAKLNGHQNVLPEGTEPEAAAHPRSGTLPGPTPAIDDAGSPGMLPASDGFAGLVAAEDMDWSSSPSAEDGVLADDPALAELLASSTAAQSRDMAVEPPVQGLDEALSLEALAADAGGPGIDGPDAIAGQEGDTAEAAAPADPLWLGNSLSLADDDAPLATRSDEGAIDLAALEARMDGLSLADDDGPIVPRERSEAVDVAGMEHRLGGLSLADLDSYGHGALRGAVMVEAGLGGPDAVRQLLGGLGAAFPRAVLVRLQLDGGRYERLVQQMQRASVLPVALAEAGAEAAAGTVYFLPPDIAVAAGGSSLRFAAAAPDAAINYDMLPATDSALVFLSGASAGRVDRAMALADAGALVLAQAPDSCYDATAVNALVGRGAVAAQPGNMAQALIDRWP